MRLSTVFYHASKHLQVEINRLNEQLDANNQTKKLGIRRRIQQLKKLQLKYEREKIALEQKEKDNGSRICYKSIT